MHIAHKTSDERRMTESSSSSSSSNPEHGRRIPRKRDRTNYPWPLCYMCVCRCHITWKAKKKLWEYGGLESVSANICGPRKSHVQRPPFDRRWSSRNKAVLSEQNNRRVSTSTLRSSRQTCSLQAWVWAAMQSHSSVSGLIETDKSSYLKQN